MEKQIAKGWIEGAKAIRLIRKIKKHLPIPDAELARKAGISQYKIYNIRAGQSQSMKKSDYAKLRALLTAATTTLEDTGRRAPNTPETQLAAYRELNHAIEMARANANSLEGKLTAKVSAAEKDLYTTATMLVKLYKQLQKKTDWMVFGFLLSALTGVALYLFT
jgi:transcriptional regulator with XRE-family HTH domain